MTATGPVHFAWVESSETTFGPEHQIWDESLLSFAIDHEEAQFPRLTVTFRNTGEGVLAPGRKIWAWLSWNTTPLFFGRIVAMPDNILGERITYVLRARPNDYQDLYQTLSDSLRVAPYYDPIFVSDERRDDPASAWEGYSRSVHIDRVTLAVTSSDWLVGEDGVIDFGPDQATYSSLQLSVPRTPIKAVTVKGGVPWKQSATDAVIDLGRRTFNAYNGASFLSGWPKPGDALAGGYYVVNSSVRDFLGTDTRQDQRWNISWKNEQKKHRDGDTMSIEESFSGPAGTFPNSGVTLREYREVVIADPATGTPGRSSVQREALIARPYAIETTLSLGISALRDLKDNASLRLIADIQPVLTDPDDDGDEEIIELDSVDVSKECRNGVPIVDSDSDTDLELPPIEDPGRAGYIPTDRGMDSVRYMLARARARLVMGSRVADVEWDCSFEDALALSCRKNARITTSRIPGGTAVGKIVAYSLRGDGATGQFRGHVKISCAVGLGSALEIADGTGVVFESDVVEPDVQVFIGRLVALSSGDVSVGDPILVAGGGGLAFNNLSASDLVVRAELVSSAADQESELMSTWVSPSFNRQNPLAYWQELHEAHTRAMFDAIVRTQVYFELELVNLEGAGIEAHWDIPTGDLVLPKQIDFTAPAG